MHTVEPRDSVEQLILELDLEPIMVKAMHPTEGMGWTREKTEEMALTYRLFLILVQRHPNATHIVSKELDEFWHLHILDTQKYMEDCQRIFGRYIHHFPYFGMRSAEDKAALQSAGAAMDVLWLEEFGFPRTLKGENDCTGCGSGCSEGTCTLSPSHDFVTRPRLGDLETVMALAS